MTGVHYLPPWATRPVNLCPDCRRERRAGERHSMTSGFTEDGEPLDVVCLDADGEVLLRPDPWPALDAEVASDPWSTHTDEPPPF